MSRIKCSTVQRRLAGVAPQDGRLEAHLRACPGCREAAEQLARLDATIQGLGQVVPPERFAGQVVQAAQRITVASRSGSRWLFWQPAWRLAATVLGGLLLGVFVGNVLFFAPPASASEVLVCQIDGMMCAACATTVENLILEVEGMKSVEVDWLNGTAKIQLAPGQPLRVHQLIEALERGRRYNLQAIELTSQE